MSTATTESLFLAPIDPKALFTKEATIARMPDDDRKWPESVLSALYKQLPFLSGMDIALNFNRIANEAGYGFGYAIVRGQKNAVGLPTPKSENQMVRIPIIIEEQYLQPFHVFLFEGKTLPLTQARFEEAMENPRVFAGSDAPPKEEKSLVDQLYPPYQQRQGFGRIVDGTSGMTGSSMGINKVAQSQPPVMARRSTKMRLQGTLSKRKMSKQADITDIPNYAQSQTEDMSCKTCKFYASSSELGKGFCNKYQTDVQEQMVCDSWAVGENAPPVDKLASYTKFLMGVRQ